MAAQRHAALATLLRAGDVLEWRLASWEHMPGSGELAWLWETLVQLDTVHRCHLAAAAVHHITEHRLASRDAGTGRSRLYAWSKAFR
ncbi:hypothetical protein [Streptomyces anandii]|uniref:hypothetical protein n=1 Tax=Streptomyces anandii TaxID=285454 RepID=UPI0037BC3558